MADLAYSTGLEDAAALIEQAKSEGVRLSVAPNGGLRCVGRMSPQLRAGLLSCKEVVLLVLRQGAPDVDHRHDHERQASTDQSPLLDRLGDAAEALAEAPVIESRQEPGAVLIQSPRFGPVWIALTPGMADEHWGEEAQRLESRPVLLTDDIAKLRGKSEAAVRAALEVARAFPGARVRKPRIKNLRPPRPRRGRRVSPDAGPLPGQMSLCPELVPHVPLREGPEGEGGTDDTGN